jgi:hypothetical protein
MIMRKILTILILLSVSLGTVGCETGVTISLPSISNLPRFDFGGTKQISGSGNVVKENRILRDIQEVSLNGGGNLIITQGTEEGMEIEAEDNLIQFFRIEVAGARLTIDSNPNSDLSPTEPINFYLRVKNINNIILKGSGNIQSESIKSDLFSMTLDGSGDIKIPKFRANSLIVSIPGSGDIRLSGSVIDQDITVGGSGNYFAKGLTSVTTKIKVSGSGSVEVQAKEALDANIKGSGLVRYSGNPKVTRSISGSGSVERIPK